MRDFYVYPGTDVLKNKFDEMDSDKFLELESVYTANRIAELWEHPIEGNFNFHHLQRIHKYIFQDIFDWAGEFRKINIEKPESVLSGLSVAYDDVMDLARNLENMLTRLSKENWNESKDQNVKLFCYYLTEVWKIHPFREGNTRSTMLFFYELMAVKNVRFDPMLLSDNAEYVRTSLVAAAFALEGVCERNYTYLEKIVDEAMT